MKPLGSNIPCSDQASILQKVGLITGLLFNALYKDESIILPSDIGSRWIPWLRWLFSSPELLLATFTAMLYAFGTIDLMPLKYYITRPSYSRGPGTCCQLLLANGVLRLLSALLCHMSLAACFPVNIFVRAGIRCVNLRAHQLKIDLSTPIPWTSRLVQEASGRHT